jgi:hypothetical protein
LLQRVDGIEARINEIDARVKSIEVRPKPAVNPNPPAVSKSEDSVSYQITYEGDRYVWDQSSKAFINDAGKRISFSNMGDISKTPDVRICVPGPNGTVCTWLKVEKATKQSLPPPPLVIPPNNNQTSIDPASADTQSTPWPGISAMLNTIKPKPHEVLLDPGCGDAGILIAACRYFNTQKAIGVERDPEIAELARRNVEQVGFSDRIEIITGDSTKLDIKADIAIMYMWSEFLAAYRPKLEKLNRFACYEFKVPDLPMVEKTTSDGGKFYVWNRPPVMTKVPITRQVSRRINLPRGSYCTVCQGRCSRPMTHVSQNVIVGYRDVLMNQ